MRISAPIQSFLRTKRSGTALLLFALGLLALPAAFTASGIHYHFALSLRPYLDYFEWGMAAVGFACCVVAPLIVQASVAKKLLLVIVAVGAYVLDLFFSAIASMVTFGLN